MVQANARHLCRRVPCNGLLEKHKSGCQKTIVEVPTQLFGIWRKNMKRGQLNYLPQYITFIYEN